MTIVGRRRAYRSLFALSCLGLAAFVPLFRPFAEGAELKAFLVKAGAFESLRLGSVRIDSPLAVGVGIGLCALYSALTLGVILSLFRKTVSTEIFFFAFWLFSVGMEALRLGALALALEGVGVRWQIVAAKTHLFFRYAGLFSMLAAGLYAAGLRNEKHGTAIALVYGVAFALAAAMPMNTGSYAATLELSPGYGSLNSVLAVVVGLATITTFLHAASSSKERSYGLAAAGCAALLIGHRLLLTQWNPVLLALGLVLLATGSWLFISRLHAYYLWQ